MTTEERVREALRGKTAEEVGDRVTRALGVAISEAYATGRSRTPGPARPGAIDQALAVLEGTR